MKYGHKFAMTKGPITYRFNDRIEAMFCVSCVINFSYASIWLNDYKDFFMFSSLNFLNPTANRIQWNLPE